MDKAVYKLIGALVTLVLIVLSVGCATVTKGTSQTLTLTTEPPGARCTLTRAGAILAVINTPGSLKVKKDDDHVSVSCELATYKNISGVFESKYDNTIVGNVILGGVVGAMIDAGSGATYEYVNPTLTLTMIPERFASIAERDVFFEKMKADFLEASEVAMAEIAETCNPNTCELDKRKAEKAKEARLVEIENERQIATIGDVGTPLVTSGPDIIQEQLSQVEIPDSLELTTRPGQTLIIYGQGDEACKSAPHFDWIRSHVITRMPRNGMLSDAGVVERESQDCNGEVVPVTAIAYTPDDGFTGTDTVTFWNKETVIIDVEAGQEQAGQATKTVTPASIGTTQGKPVQTALIDQETTLEGMDALMIGTWKGDYYYPAWGRGWSREITLHIKAKDSQSYIGTGSSHNCKDIEANLRHDSGDMYLVTFTGCNRMWDAEGRLRYKDSKLRGTVRLRYGPYTFDMAKAE